ncbi:hypothetical protein [Amycolatopsis keratiniphila]|uniref:hypothetical protein n=1 Tax=Amycolatopsis keratiniphila TaxID=129921 RepID=UPI000AFC48C3|nr:hypothetical protein [Amycolatopsis keratiniphila]
MRATPLPVLRAEIAELSRHGTIPRWLRLIRDGGSDELNALADAVLGYFRKHLAPDWPVVADAIAGAVYGARDVAAAVYGLVMFLTASLFGYLVTRAREPAARQGGPGPP